MEWAHHCHGYGYGYGYAFAIHYLLLGLNFSSWSRCKSNGPKGKAVPATGCTAMFCCAGVKPSALTRIAMGPGSPSRACT